MKNPFRYRPNPDADVDHDGKVPDWEDNALSNFFAWASTVFTPTWCQSEDDRAARFANYLWTSCPCCMLFRGLFLGIGVSTLVWLLLIFTLVILNARSS
jgi:hypothetical protein